MNLWGKVIMETRESFIDNLKHTDSAEWEDFYNFYGPMIIGFARKRGCNSERAADVLQETIVAVLRILPDFSYDRNRGKFRTLLFKIAESKIVDAYRREKFMVGVSDPELVAQYKIPSSDKSTTWKLWKETWDNHLLGEALKRAQARVKPLTYRCFELIFLRKKKVAKVAEELGISPNLASQHKHKVYSLILEEAEKIREEYGE